MMQLLCVSWAMDHGFQCKSEGPSVLPAVACLSQRHLGVPLLVTITTFYLSHLSVHVHFIAGVRQFSSVGTM